MFMKDYEIKCMLIQSLIKAVLLKLNSNNLEFGCTEDIFEVGYFYF